MDNRKQILKQLAEAKQLQGRKEYIKYLEGGKLTQREAIKAYCYDCMGYYDDGAQDCESDICPLRPFMPYVVAPLKQKKIVKQETVDKMLRTKLSKQQADAEVKSTSNHTTE